MSFNSSPLQDNWCFSISPNNSKSRSLCYQVTLAVSVAAAVLAPMTVAGNGLILAAIWRNPSLRTPSYVLLAGLAFTDFCTGLITQPFYAVLKFAIITGNRKKYCHNPGLEHFSDGIGYYFSSITIFVMAMIAVERWLHMSRRSLLTVRRVVVIYIALASLLIFVAAGRTYTRHYDRHKAFGVIQVCYSLMGCLCLMIMAFSYFKVFQIIRHHQNQVQTNESAIDMEKYKRSIFTILYILAVFVLTYVPFICAILVSQAFSSNNNGISCYAPLRACTAVVFSSSFFNPLLYYWRIKEIRDSVKSIVRKLLCKQNGEES